MNKFISIIIAFLLVIPLNIMCFAKTVKPGDINKDGIITASDARSILRFAAKLDRYTEDMIVIADLNNDNLITTADARKALRISARLEKELPEITIGSYDITPAICTVISSFDGKYGEVTEIGTSDNTKAFGNNSIMLISDPDMISDDKISSIIITGAGYSANGIETGISEESAKSILAESRWASVAQSGNVISFRKDGLLINLTSENSVITKIEYKLSRPLIDTETDNDSNTEDNSDYISFDDIPEAAQHYLNGEFGIKGSIFSGGTSNDVSMYTDGTNINMSMIVSTEDIDADLTILVLDEGKSEQSLYILNNDNKKYTELTDSTFAILKTLTGGKLDINKNTFKIDFSLNDPSTLKITQSEIIEDDITYTVYHAQGQSTVTNLYFDSDNLKKVVTTDIDGNIRTKTEITEFMYPLPESCFSYEGYRQTGLMTLIDSN